MNIDQRLRDSYSEPAIRSPGPDFEDQILTRLPASQSSRRSPASLLALYWAGALIVAMAVFARIGWLQPDWTALLVIAASLASVVIPVLILVRATGLRLLDLFWNTVED